MSGFLLQRGPPLSHASSSTSSCCERNLRLYPWYVGGVAFYAWMPIFFLYFSQAVSLPEVLGLEAIYYVAIVCLEVPSGYMSDHWGRRPALIVAACALCVSFGVFVVGSGFWTLAFAQVLLALGLAMNSGTDTSFHLATLTALGKQGEYDTREAKLGSLAFLVSAGAALIGGGLGVVDLRLAYGASFLGAAVALGGALGFREVSGDEGEQGFSASLTACFTLLKGRHLAWVFVLAVGATVINHLPYEFYQPYINRLPGAPWPTQWVPFVAGVHLAMVHLVAAPVARQSAWLARRLGVAWYLLGSVALQVMVVVAMSWTIDPVVGVFLLCRSVPSGLQSAPIRAQVAPRVPGHLRATYLSLQSLAGRLGFALVLVGFWAGGSKALEVVLWQAACVAAGVFGALVVWTVMLRPRFGSESG